MLNRAMKLALPLAAVMLVAGSAWAANNTITPNAGPFSGGQLLTITGNGPYATGAGATTLTIGPATCTLVGIGGAGGNMEAYFTTPTGGAALPKGGIYDVVVGGAGGPETLTGAYQAVKAADNDMLQVRVSATVRQTAEIAWSATTTSPDDNNVLHPSGDIQDFNWTVRDGQLSGAPVIPAANYFVDLNSTYVSNDPDNNKTMLIENTSRVASTKINLYATAQSYGAGDWALAVPPAGINTDVYTLSANRQVGVVQLGPSAAKLTNSATYATGAANAFPLVITMKTPTTTVGANPGNANQALIQITATL